MNNRQLECFLEAGKELSITQAAKNLYLPQPTVSRYIQALEKELGTELFIRESKRSFQLSEAGKAYHSLFLRFYNEFENTKELLHASQKTLRFGYNNGWNISFFLPDVINQCRKKYPEMSISIECMEFHDLLESTLNGRLDAVLSLSDYLSHHSSIIQEQITTIRKVIIYSEMLLPKQYVSGPEAFRDFDFYIVKDERIRQLQAEIEDCCKSYHFVPRLKRLMNTDTVIANVENGMGVAIMDEWGKNIDGKGIRYVELDSCHPVCLAWNRKTDLSAVRIFKEELMARFDKIPV
ncbi:MAG: LysR family transcriptional regulator [Eubacterium sp.]|nr:LysR family transcriptional regulator [Eubacterium sp.]